MKCLGLIGVDGVETTAFYARQIEVELWHRYEDAQPPNLVALSLQTKEFSAAFRRKDWPAISRLISSSWDQLAALGAQKFILCSSELHLALDSAPMAGASLSITDAVIQAVLRARHTRVAVLGAASPQEEQFWKSRLETAGVPDVLLPVAVDRTHVSTLLRRYFARGLMNEEARADVLRIANSLRQAGAKAVVIPTPALAAVFHNAVPIVQVIDAAALHAVAAVDWMASELIPAAVMPPDD